MRELTVLAILLAGCQAAAPARRPADDLFPELESDDPRRALAAVAALAPILTAEDLPRVGKLLDGRHAGRALLLLREARLDAAGPILEKRAKGLLDPDKADLAKVALGTFGALKLRGTSPAIRDYYLSQAANEDAALKALGRIWDRKLDHPPLSGEAEHERLNALRVVLGVALRAAEPAACEAALKIMTRGELGGLLDKQPTGRLASTFVEVCAKGGFDPEKGAMVHAGLLSNPDADVVALVLWSSPYQLDAAAFLSDERQAAPRELPEARVCDYAAARLEAEEAKKAVQLPDSPEEREKLLAKWRANRPR